MVFDVVQRLFAYFFLRDYQGTHLGGRRGKFGLFMETLEALSFRFLENPQLHECRSFNLNSATHDTFISSSFSKKWEDVKFYFGRGSHIWDTEKHSPFYKRRISKDVSFKGGRVTFYRIVVGKDPPFFCVPPESTFWLDRLSIIA
jgi:hypothetical protein